MTSPLLSRLAVDILASEAPPRSSPSLEHEARAVLAIEAAIRSAARRRRLRRSAVAVASGIAIAAMVALFVGWRTNRPNAPSEAVSARALATTAHVSAHGNVLSDGVVVVREGRELAFDEGVALEASDRIVTAEAGRASITLSTGTHLVVEGSADFTIVEQGATTSFAVAAGRVRADVAKLHAGERFLIRTPDGEVEVRGTSFEVAVVAPLATCGGGTMTRVAVSEGVVVVRSAGAEASVRKGESWPRNCTTALAEARPTAAPATNPSSAAGRGPTTPQVPTSPSTATPLVTAVSSLPAGTVASSELAAQNALFAEASAARRRGDLGAAIAAYEGLTARYPSSPLAESAYVERMRILSASDPRQSREGARAYLARYPQGFARAEAGDLLASPR